MENYKTLLPEEAGEMTLTEIAQLRKVERQLRQVFESENYQEVMPPGFEYLSLYTELDTGFDQEKMFQFINHEGQSIALRYDFTLPLVRSFAKSGQTEARYSYFGKVFRKEKRHKGRQTERYQVGVELLGAARGTADKEILSLALRSLDQLPLKEVVLELGSASFYERLMSLTQAEAALPPLLQKKDLSGLEAFIKKSDFTPAVSDLLRALPLTSDVAELLSLTQKADQELYEMVQKLSELLAEINDPRLRLDLSKVPSMSYYTGLMIEAYATGSNQPILSGGRYDEMLSEFGLDAGAVGFCCYMDNMVKALEAEEDD